ncbi:trans-aconitate methyltransferase 1 [Thecaphora frezii]
MSTFSKPTFDAASYLAFRPTYPSWTYHKLLTYHFGRLPSPSHPLPSPKVGGKPTLALDLGCGPGISTLQLLPFFDRVVGIDPSKNMVDAAVTPHSPGLPEALRPRADQGGRGKLGELRYRMARAEELEWVEAQSVDLVTAGQAAHWFDYDRLWPALARILRPGGSVVFWGYPDMFFPDYPSTRRLVMEWAVSTSPVAKEEGIGPYWEQPGRSILSHCLQSIPVPQTGEWDQDSAISRVYSTEGLEIEQRWQSWPPVPGGEKKDLDPKVAQLPRSGGVTEEAKEAIEQDATMEMRMSWCRLEKYLRTWSAVGTYKERNPGDGERREGDVVERFLGRTKEEIKRKEGGTCPEEVRVRWPVGVWMLKKRL